MLVTLAVAGPGRVDVEPRPHQHRDHGGRVVRRRRRLARARSAGRTTTRSPCGARPSPSGCVACSARWPSCSSSSATPSRRARATPTGPFQTESELRDLVDMAGDSDVIEADEREMIHSVFELGDTVARERHGARAPTWSCSTPTRRCAARCRSSCAPASRASPSSARTATTCAGCSTSRTSPAGSTPPPRTVGTPPPR